MQKFVGTLDTPLAGLIEERRGGEGVAVKLVKRLLLLIAGAMTALYVVSYFALMQQEATIVNAPAGPAVVEAVYFPSSPRVNKVAQSVYTPMVWLDKKLRPESWDPHHKRVNGLLTRRH